MIFDKIASDSSLLEDNGNTICGSSSERASAIVSNYKIAKSSIPMQLLTYGLQEKTKCYATHVGPQNTLLHRYMTL